MSNFHPLEVVGRGSYPQLQVGEKGVKKVGEKVGEKLNWVTLRFKGGLSGPHQRVHLLGECPAL